MGAGRTGGPGRSAHGRRRYDRCVRQRDALLFVDYVSRIARRVRRRGTRPAGRDGGALAAPPRAAPHAPRRGDQRARRSDAQPAGVRRLRRAPRCALSTIARRWSQWLPPAPWRDARRAELRAAGAAAPAAVRALAAQLRLGDADGRWGRTRFPELLAAFADPGQPAEARAIVADALNALHVLEAADIAGRIARASNANRDLVAAALRSAPGPRPPRARAPRCAHCSPARTTSVRTAAIAAFGALGLAGRAGAADPGARRPVALGCTRGGAGTAVRSVTARRSARWRSGTTRTRSSRPKCWRRAPDGLSCSLPSTG